MESRARIGGSGTPRFTFTVSTITPEEDLRNNAMSVVMGYQQQRLGKRQQEMLRRMAGDRSKWDPWGGGYWGLNYDNRRVLTALERRELVASMPPTKGTDAWRAGAYSYNLTKLGFEVARILKGNPFL